MNNIIVKCKDCIYSYEGASGSNCPYDIIKECGLPLHCIVDGYKMNKIVYKNFSCNKGIRKHGYLDGV